MDSTILTEEMLKKRIDEGTKILLDFYRNGGIIYDDDEFETMSNPIR